MGDTRHCALRMMCQSSALDPAIQTHTLAHTPTHTRACTQMQRDESARSSEDVRQEAVRHERLVLLPVRLVLLAAAVLVAEHAVDVLRRPALRAEVRALGDATRSCSLVDEGRSPTIRWELRVRFASNHLAVDL